MFAHLEEVDKREAGQFLGNEGPMTQIGNALVTAVVVGDVAAVKAAVDAGAQAVKGTG